MSNLVRTKINAGSTRVRLIHQGREHVRTHHVNLRGADEIGILADFGEEGRGNVFVPWTSVVQIEFD